MVNLPTANHLVCIVTGANKGIGLAVTRALCSLDRDEPRLVYLTSRDRVSGEQAVKLLQKEGHQPRYHQLDITNDESVNTLFDYMKDKYGGIDVLINNAGIAYKNDSQAPFSDQAKVTVETNFGGTRRVCKKLFPLLRKGARLVNVTSNCGHLSKITGEEQASKVLRDRLASQKLTEEELVGMMDQFVKLANEGEHVKSGWPNSAYKVSKVGVSALTILQQRTLDVKRGGEDIVINHVHPGYVDTDMTSHKGHRTVDEGAQSIVFAATLSANTNIRGEYIWEDSSVTSWVEEKVNLFY